MTKLVLLTLPCDNYKPYSPVMSCCKSEEDHKSHTAHQAIMQYMERSNYTIIPPVSTGFFTAKMSKEAAIKFLQNKKEDNKFEGFEENYFHE